jgi:hypothetical protein
MFSRSNVTFQEALEIIEALPEYQQEDLVNVIKNRIIEQRRELLAKNIREAKEEYARGEVKKGTVDDLMKELTE